MLIVKLYKIEISNKFLIFFDKSKNNASQELIYWNLIVWRLCVLKTKSLKDWKMSRNNESRNSSQVILKNGWITHFDCGSTSDKWLPHTPDIYSCRLWLLYKCLLRSHSSHSINNSELECSEHWGGGGCKKLWRDVWFIWARDVFLQGMTQMFWSGKKQSRHITHDSKHR